MVVDIGGGTTEVAMISLGGIVSNQSIRIAGNELDEAIIQHLKQEHGVAVGIRTAENIKMKLGSDYLLEKELLAELYASYLATGLPRTVNFTTTEIREAMAFPLMAIIDAIKVTLDSTPPELAADVMERGIMLTGGGALLVGLVERLTEEIGMKVLMAPDPLNSVVLGAGKALEEIDRFGTIFFGSNQE